MPWCDDCERFSNPNTLTENGGCPGCGTVIAEAPEAGIGSDRGEGEAAGADLTSIPWHFWLLLIALIAYLGWRLVEGIGWVIGRF